MNRAEQMKAALTREEMTFEDLLDEARAISNCYDSENYSYSFEFADGSVAVFNFEFGELFVYGCRD